MKKFFEHKAKAVKAWMEFTRGNLIFQCRLPSAAKASFSDAANGTGALKVKTESLIALQTTIDASLEGTKASVEKLFGFAKIALEKIGGAECADKFKEIEDKRKE